MTTIQPPGSSRNKTELISHLFRWQRAIGWSIQTDTFLLCTISAVSCFTQSYVVLMPHILNSSIVCLRSHWLDCLMYDGCHKSWSIGAILIKKHFTGLREKWNSLIQNTEVSKEWRRETEVHFTALYTWSSQCFEYEVRHTGKGNEPPSKQTAAAS